jgi:hypothetical protein
LKEKYRGREEEEEYFISYWMTLRKREDTGLWKWKYLMAICG